MTIAAQIDPVLAARQARAAATVADRVARDAFIVAQFALLGARFGGLLHEALGLHSGIALAVIPMVYAVQGRSFATLSVDTWSVAASFNATPQTVLFAPRLDFREPDQFGLIECTLDFAYLPLRSRADATAQALLGTGIQLRGKTVASLLLPLAASTAELVSADLENAFRTWWLR